MIRRLLASLLIAAWVVGCQTATAPPPGLEILTLSGSPYQRGYQHGKHFQSKIKSFYQRLLASSLLPYLSREQPDIAGVLAYYQQPQFADGQFAWQLLLESGLELEKSIPAALRDEMRGVADGAGLPYAQILVLNTFLDSLLALRSITFFLRGLHAPRIARVQAGAHVQEPYEPLPHATFVEVPADVSVHVVLTDGAGLQLPGKPGKPAEGVDPATVRVQLDTEVLTPGHPRLALQPLPDGALDVAVLPPFAPARKFTLLVQAGDKSLVTQPPPARARFMRDERIVFTTVGYGQPATAVANEGFDDGRSQPTSLALGVRGQATPDAQPRLAHHFALLDANTAHDHTAVFIHRPEHGEPFAVVGWAGIVWGTSGQNGSGLALALQPSDTLDNGMVAALLAGLLDPAKVRLRATGVPAGVALRQALELAADVTAATAQLAATPQTFGWNFLAVDAKGGLRALEVDANSQNDSDQGRFAWGPGEHGASVGPDDLRLAVHALANQADFDLDLGIAALQPQRFWTTYWFRSLRGFFGLGSALKAKLGQLDAAGLAALLRTPALVDHRDSMNAVVLEPGLRTLHVAAGRVPATDAPFVRLVLPEARP
jgi:hypothetical protein